MIYIHGACEGGDVWLGLGVQVCESCYVMNFIILIEKLENIRFSKPSRIKIHGVETAIEIT